MAQKQPPQTKVVVRQDSFVGPLPHPDILAKYDQVSPGSAAIILKAFQDEIEHRQSMERVSLNSDMADREMQIKRMFDERRLGQIFAFVLCFMTIIGGVTLAAFGKEIAGSVFGTAGLAALAYVFITGRRTKQE